MKKNHFNCIATDCGGSGCKSLFAEFDGNKVIEREYIGFPNAPLRLGDHVYIDINAIYNDAIRVISDLKEKYGNPNVLGFDTHGALYFLVDALGRQVRMPYHRFETSHPDLLERLHEKVSHQEVYQMTGSVATRGFCLPWLYADLTDPTGAIKSADKLLMFPDMLNYLFTGVMGTERTVAGTSCMTTADQTGWNFELLNKLGAPETLFLPFEEPCSRIEKVNKTIEFLAGIKDTDVALVASHDSATAVAAVPGFGKKKLYVCLGTMANINFLSDGPVIDEKARGYGFKTTTYMGKGEYMIYRMHRHS